MYTTYLQRKEIGDTWCKNPKKLVDFGWNDSCGILKLRIVALKCFKLEVRIFFSSIVIILKKLRYKLNLVAVY